MKKSLENQLMDAREETEKVLSEFHKHSKNEIIIIWILSLFVIGTIGALLFTI